MAKHFSPLYRNYIRSDRWRSNRKLTVSFFGGRDALIPLMPGREVDHLHYSGLKRWATGIGQECPVVDAVLLHPLTHKIVGGLRTVFGRSIVNWIIRVWAVAILPITWGCAIVFGGK